MGATPIDQLQSDIPAPASATGSGYPQSTADVCSQAGALCQTALQLREAAQRLHEQIQGTHGEEDRSEPVLRPESGPRRHAGLEAQTALLDASNRVLREEAQVLRWISRITRQQGQAISQRSLAAQQRADEVAVWAVAADDRALAVGVRAANEDG